MGTKIGAKIAHLAEPEDTKMLTKEQRRIKATHRGIPCEADVLQEVSAADG